jgi:hypothetical protein
VTHFLRRHTFFHCHRPLYAGDPDWLDLAADWYPPDMTKAQIDAWLARIAAIDDKSLQV